MTFTYFELGNNKNPKRQLLAGFAAAMSTAPVCVYTRFSEAAQVGGLGCSEMALEES